jgi:peptidoglycan lytic transglycosylase C
MNVSRESRVANFSSDLKPTQPASSSALNRRRLLQFGLYTMFVAGGCAKSASNSEDHAAGVTTARPTSLVSDYATADQSLKDATGRLQSKCASLWGTAHTELPAQKVWVSYDKDWISRGHVDFEHGEFVAQALVDADQANDIGPALRLLHKRLEDAQKSTASDMADDDKVLKLARELARERGLGLADPTAPVAKGDPVLAGILPADAASRLTTGALQRTAIVGDDGKPRVMLTYRVNFLDGYHARLAAPYVDAVQREARRYELQPSLVLAITETESAFNPRARSGAPAFGLMQLVPKSGGCDAYQHAFGSFRIPDPDYLYVPDNNIRLGSAYLQLLDRRDLHGINNLQSRGYAVVAAYNTGAGNVARAFGGTTHVGTAADAVNKMSSEDVLRHLQERLPFDETRKYLTNVVARRSRYNGLDDDGAQMM